MRAEETFSCIALEPQEIKAQHLDCLTKLASDSNSVSTCVLQ